MSGIYPALCFKTAGFRNRICEFVGMQRLQVIKIKACLRDICKKLQISLNTMHYFKLLRSGNDIFAMNASEYKPTGKLIAAISA